MKKITLMLALVFSVAAANSFAADKDKDMKCKAGKDCCKKMEKESAAAKAKCAKTCAKEAKKAA